MSLDKSEVLNNEASSYIKTLPSKNVEPLWTVMNAMVPPLPNPKASITSWKYNEIRPLLLEAGRLVSDKEAERRVLMLVNPTMKAPYTTDTIYAGLQLINPGETAPAHRHTAFALRFIIEGERGFTAVGGKKVVMRRGDVILTPSWEWHDHGHEGIPQTLRYVRGRGKANEVHRSRSDDLARWVRSSPIPGISGQLCRALPGGQISERVGTQPTAKDEHCAK